MKETLEIIKAHLNENKLEKEHTTQLIKIIETIMNQNYLQFNNKLYEQKEGNHVRNLLTKHRERTFPQHQKKI